MTTITTNTKRIAQLNDRARTAMGVTCVLVVTPGFRALNVADQSRVRELVEIFNVFTKDNDPYGERDFGAIYQAQNGAWTMMRVADEQSRVFWKIDYFDRDLKFASEDPADPAKTRRVLTIMLASEY